MGPLLVPLPPTTRSGFWSSWPAARWACMAPHWSPVGGHVRQRLFGTCTRACQLVVRVGAGATTLTSRCSHNGAGVTRNGSPAVPRERGRRQIAGWRRALGLTGNAARAVVRMKPCCVMAVHGPRTGVVPRIPAQLDAGVNGAARWSAHRARRIDAYARARLHVAVPVDVVFLVVD